MKPRRKVLPPPPLIRMDWCSPETRRAVHPAVTRMRAGDVLYVIDSSEDSLGRVYFTRYSTVSYRCGHPIKESDSRGRLLRAQCFHARVQDYTGMDSNPMVINDAVINDAVYGWGPL